MTFWLSGRAGTDPRGAVGPFMGATASLLAAAMAPASCRSLVLFDPVMPPPRPWRDLTGTSLIEAAGRPASRYLSQSCREDALKSYRDRGAFRTWPEPMLADYVDAGFRDFPDGQITLACTPAWEASSYAAQEHDSWEALRRSTCPIDMLCAEVASTFHPSGKHQDLGDRVTAATGPGTSHFLPRERPDLVQSALGMAVEAPSAAGPKTSVPA